MMNTHPALDPSSRYAGRRRRYSVITGSAASQTSGHLVNDTVLLSLFLSVTYPDIILCHVTCLSGTAYIDIVADRI